MRFATWIGMFGVGFALLGLLGAICDVYGFLGMDASVKDFIYPMFFALFLIPIGFKVERLEKKLKAKKEA